MLALNCYLLLIHWLADFVFLNKWLSQNRGICTKALFIHVAIYCLTFYVFLLPFYVPSKLLQFIMFNGIIHLVVDFMTGQLMQIATETQSEKTYFMAFGTDQVIHMIILIITSEKILGPL